jgi:hypothetical protein
LSSAKSGTLKTDIARIHKEQIECQ